MATQTRPRITAQVREASLRKSAVRELRQRGIVPGSLFGHGEPQSIQISARELHDLLKEHASGALMDLDLNGQASTAVIRNLERHPVSGQVVHVGLQRVDVGETIHAVIPVTFAGEEDLVKEGLVLERQMAEVDVSGRADEIPESITIDVASRRPGDLIHVSDLSLPSGITAVKGGDSIVARISSPTVAPDVAAALEAEDAAHQALVESHGTGDADDKESEPAEDAS